MNQKPPFASILTIRNNSWKLLRRKCVTFEVTRYGQPSATAYLNTLCWVTLGASASASLGP